VLAPVYERRARSSALLCARLNVGELARKVMTVDAVLIAKQPTRYLQSSERVSWR